MPHSFLSASTGLMRAARQAGRKPEMRPVTMATVSARRITEAERAMRLAGRNFARERSLRAKQSFAGKRVLKRSLETRGKRAVPAPLHTATGTVTSAVFFGSARFALWLSAISSATNPDSSR